MQSGIHISDVLRPYEQQYPTQAPAEKHKIINELENLLDKVADKEPIGDLLVKFYEIELMLVKQNDKTAVGRLEEIFQLLKSKGLLQKFAKQLWAVTTRCNFYVYYHLEELEKFIPDIADKQIIFENLIDSFQNTKMANDIKKAVYYFVQRVKLLEKRQSVPPEGRLLFQRYAEQIATADPQSAAKAYLIAFRLGHDAAIYDAIALQKNIASILPYIQEAANAVLYKKDVEGLYLLMSSILGVIKKNFYSVREINELGKIFLAAYAELQSDVFIQGKNKIQIYLKLVEIATQFKDLAESEALKTVNSPEAQAILKFLNFKEVKGQHSLLPELERELKMDGSFAYDLPTLLLNEAESHVKTNHEYTSVVMRYLLNRFEHFWRKGTAQLTDEQMLAVSKGTVENNIFKHSSANKTIIQLQEDMFEVVETILNERALAWKEKNAEKDDHFNIFYVKLNELYELYLYTPNKNLRKKLTLEFFNRAKTPGELGLHQQWANLKSPCFADNIKLVMENSLYAIALYIEEATSAERFHTYTQQRKSLPYLYTIYLLLLHSPIDKFRNCAPRLSVYAEQAEKFLSTKAEKDPTILFLYQLVQQQKEKKENIIDAHAFVWAKVKVGTNSSKQIACLKELMRSLYPFLGVVDFEKWFQRLDILAEGFIAAESLDKKGEPSEQGEKKSEASSPKVLGSLPAATPSVLLISIKSAEGVKLVPPSAPDFKAEDQEGEGWYVSPYTLEKFIQEADELLGVSYAAVMPRELKEHQEPAAVVAPIEKPKQEGELDAEQIEGVRSRDVADHHVDPLTPTPSSVPVIPTPIAPLVVSQVAVDASPVVLQVAADAKQELMSSGSKSAADSDKKMDGEIKAIPAPIPVLQRSNPHERKRSLGDSKGFAASPVDGSPASPVASSPVASSLQAGSHHDAMPASVSFAAAPSSLEKGIIPTLCFSGMGLFQVTLHKTATIHFHAGTITAPAHSTVTILNPEGSEEEPGSVLSPYTLAG